MQLSTSIWLLVYVVGVPIILIVLITLKSTDNLYIRDDGEDRVVNTKTFLSAVKVFLLLMAMCKLMTYIRAMDRLIPAFRGMKRFFVLKGVKILLTL